jgi:hypothetical protein
MLPGWSSVIKQTRGKSPKNSFLAAPYLCACAFLQDSLPFLRFLCGGRERAGAAGSGSI